MIAASRARAANGDDLVEIMLPGRRVLLFVEPDGGAGWTIASSPPHARDGCGRLLTPNDWLDVLVRGLS